MITKGCLHLCLLMLFFTDISSQNCNELRRWLQNVNKSNLELLESKMRASIPLQCIDDGRDATTTQEIFRKIQRSQGENGKVGIHEILQQTFRIFSQKHLETAWNENSVAVFKNGLDQQIKYLGSCLSANTENGIASPSGQSTQLVRLRVKKYFQRINGFLRGQQKSLCAWEIVQMEVKQCFLLVDQLIKSLHNEA
ncbi:interferon beta-like isoform X1 [Hemicordylus capensis]|uniref:interferon beta-like isoform X1 n=1 Tax=Hemicordylus capensis TaxID=884348 RepID=UPI0023037D21|nr:interferon beta-like isoform X1 [Hemicordylus capensis]XP_053155847.1 interferon beta-like isoform X1 [Hemicordylus capensis]